MRLGSTAKGRKERERDGEVSGNGEHRRVALNSHVISEELSASAWSGDIEREWS